MSYILTANDIVQARIVCFASSQIAENILHFQISGVVGTPHLNQFVQDFDSAMHVIHKTLIPSNVSYRGCGAQKIWPLPVTIEEITTANVGNGTFGTAMLPSQAAGLISFQTAVAGRAYRGRTYIGFPSTSAITSPNQGPNPTYLSSLAQWASDILNFNSSSDGGGNSCDCELVIYHRKAGKGGMPPAHSADMVIQGIAKPNWATQRRRGMLGRQNVEPF